MSYPQNSYRIFVDYSCAKKQAMKITFLYQKFATLIFLYFIQSKALPSLTKIYTLELGTLKLNPNADEEVYSFHYKNEGKVKTSL